MPMRWVWGACAAIGMGLVVAWPCAGQLRVVAETPFLEADPGAFVTLVFSVFNDGPSAAQVDLEVVLPPPFVALGTPQNLNLAPGGSETLFLTVTVSPQAPAGQQTVSLTARLASDPLVSAQAQAVVAVRQRLGLRVQPPAERVADVQQTVTLTFLVSNEGNAMDQVLLSVESPASVSASLAVARLSLLPGETRPVEVEATVTASATPGRVRILLRAASLLFPEVVAQALATLTVLPLPPQDVGGHLVLEVPSQLRFSVVLNDVADMAELAMSLNGSANFEDQDRIAYALNVVDLDVRAMRFELTRGYFETRLGLLNLPFGRLLALSGAGAQLGVRRLLGHTSLTLSALTQMQAPQLGWNLATELGGLDVRLTHLLRFADDGTFDQLSSAVLTQPLGDLLTVSSEWALSDDGGLRDLGTILNLSLRLETFSLQAELVRVGTDFTGNRADEAGFELAQFFSLDDSLALSTRLRRFQDHVNGAPGVPTDVRTEIMANLRWRAFEGGPELTSTVDFTGVERDALAQSSRLTALLRLTQDLGSNAAAGGFVRRELNLDGPSQLELLEAGLELAVSAPRLSSVLRVSQAAEVDLGAGALTFRDLEALARVTLSNETAALTLGLTRTFDVLSLDAQLQAGVGDWTASAALGFERRVSGELDLDVRLALQADFDAPIPFIPVNGRVQGNVYFDTNGNGVRDPNEAGVGDVVLSVGDAQARTDERGFYRTLPLPPGSYEVVLQRLPLQVSAALADLLRVTVARGKTVELDVPVVRVAAITGIVFDDADQDGAQGAAEGGLGGVIVQLSGQGQSLRAFAGSDGAFAFSDLLPGDYTVSLNATSLPARAEPTTPQTVPVRLGAGERVEVAFGVFLRPQTIVFAPTADFTFDPAKPRAGQPITFDASASFDPDGQVVAYAWDFDGDGEPDAQGQVVTFAFAEAGRFAVTLTVSDNDGNTDSETKPLDVVP